MPMLRYYCAAGNATEVDRLRAIMTEDQALIDESYYVVLFSYYAKAEDDKKLAGLFSEAIQKFPKSAVRFSSTLFVWRSLTC